MKSAEIRQKFFDFFESKQHKIVPSAPMVVKNDPTLMFTNAGMNQFKDYFPGKRKVGTSTNCRYPKMPACFRKTQRPGRSRARYLPPHHV
jgi:alanyl-tRNA synthetase